MASMVKTRRRMAERRKDKATHFLAEASATATAAFDIHHRSLTDQERVDYLREAERLARRGAVTLAHARKALV